MRAVTHWRTLDLHFTIILYVLTEIILSLIVGNKMPLVLSANSLVPREGIFRFPVCNVNKAMYHVGLERKETGCSFNLNDNPSKCVSKLCG